MASYTFDGDELKDSRHEVIARVRGDEIQDARHNTVGRIKGDEIQDSHHNTVARIDGEEIQDSRHSRIGTLAEVRNLIDGPGGRTLAALWVLLVR